MLKGVVTIEVESMSDALIDPNGAGELDMVMDLLMANHQQLHDELEAHELLEDGLPSTALVRLVERVGILSERQNLTKALGISPDSLQHYQQEQDQAAVTLTLEESNRVWRFAAVLTKATEVLGSQQLAEEWLVRPAMALNRRRPIDLVSTEAGSELVEELLTRMEYGVYT
jgi:putative toxin-antitoxin system antitoxin component (TIGR02293 family)